MYVVNTALVSVVLTLVQRESLTEVWKHWCLGSLPFYLVGVIIVAATLSAERQVTSEAALLVAPAILLTTIYFHIALRSPNNGLPYSQGVSRGV
jgi:biotin transporter BioY